MIELRWALQHRGYIEKERVLQFRRQMIVYNGSEGPRYEMTEWQDVPEVDVPNPERHSAAPPRSGEKE